MNPKLRRMVGSEIYEQLNRVKIVAHTSRGEYQVTEGEPRLLKVGWKKAVLTFGDEPWDGFGGDVRTSDIIDIEKLEDMAPPPGTPPRLPRWWYVSISLAGWYGQDVYIDEKLVLSKPQTDPWNNVNIPQTAFIWYKLGEHNGVIIPKGRVQRYLTLNLRVHNLLGKLHLLR